MPIQIIWGNDEKAIENEIEEIINSNISKEWETCNLSRLDGSLEDQVFQAFEETQTTPFGDGSRVILLKNNPIFNEKNDKFTAKFESIYENIPNSTLLILQNANKPDARIKTTKLIKLLIKKKKANESCFNLPDIWDQKSQLNYIENTAKKLNLNLDKNTALAILEYIGTDSSRLHSELTKALLYISAKKQGILTVEDIINIFEKNESNIFKIIDSLFTKNIALSLYHINILIDQGEPPLRLLAGLTSQVRMHTIVLLLSQENDSSKVCKLAEISNPKRLFFIRKKVKDCDPRYLIDLMNRLLNIESYLKKGNNPIDVFKENLASLT